MDEQLQVKTQQKEELRHEEPVQHMMKHLEHWDVPEGGTLEQTKAQYLERLLQEEQVRAEALELRIQQQIPQQEVNRAAPVPAPPVQQQEESNKKRRERQKKLETVQKLCPVGNEHTLDMSHAAKTQYKNKVNSLRYLDRKKADKVHADKRMMRLFCHGFNTTKLGLPATPEDKEFARQDRKFLEDYVSGDQERRRPHLERITKEMIELPLTKEMFSTEYMTSHFAELKEMGDRMVYFENLQKENPAFFDQLPQVQKDILSRTEPLFLSFVRALTMRSNAQGFDPNSGDIYVKEDAPVIQMGLDNQDFAVNIYKESFDQFRADCDEAFAQEADRIIAAQEIELQAGNDEMVQQIKKEAGDMADIEFSENVTFYQYDDLNKYRKMIKDHPEQYAANRQLLDLIYQEYYRYLDTSGSLVYKGRAIQGGIDGLNSFHATKLDKAVVKALSKKEDAIAEQKSLLDYRGNSLAELMRHLLRNKPLSEASAPILEEFRQKIAGAAPQPPEE